MILQKKLVRVGLFALFGFSLFGLCACSSMGDKPNQTLHGHFLTSERISEIVASPDRSEADRINDVRRKPERTLSFIGIRSGMVAADLSAGGGYTTELLARAVSPNGVVYGQSAPSSEGNNAATSNVVPEGNPNPINPSSQKTTITKTPRISSPQALSERAKNPILTNIIPVVRKFEDPFPPEVASNSLDLVTIMFNYHDLGHKNVDREQMNRAVFAALKPGGVYVIADHAGRVGTGISESGTLHRIEESFLRKEVEAAGFRFVAEGDFLRNPYDPRDKNTPEPPQPKDEFLLKFEKN